MTAVRQRWGLAQRAAQPASAGLGMPLSMTNPVLSGILVTPNTAMQFTAVFAAINVIATDTACLPLCVYRTRKSGGRDRIYDHPVHNLLNVSPDGETTAVRYRQAMMGHVLGWGNGYREVVFDGSGRPDALKLMAPTTRPWRSDAGRLWYEPAPSQDSLPPRRVLHLAGLGYDGLVGYSPVAMARQAIGLGIAAEEFGAALFGNGSQPRGYLKTPKKLSAEAAQRLRERFENIHQGTKNAHRLAVLEEGLEWQNSTISPDDAQFLATRQFQVIEVCRMFRLPPHKIADLANAHLSNIEESNIDYLTTTLMPWLEQIEQEVNLKLFTELERQQGYFVKHDMSAFLRGDMKSRAEWLKTLASLGVLSINQMCEIEGLNPVSPEEGGDKRLVPLNMTTLEEAGEPANVPESQEPDEPPDPTNEVEEEANEQY